MFDPEYIMTLYFVGDEALTQADVDQLSEWIGQSQENTVEFIRASFMHRAIHDALVGASLKKNVLLDLAEETNSGDEVVMDSSVSLRGVDRDDIPAEKKEEAVLDNDIMQLILELSEYEKTAPAIEVPKVEPPRELIQKVVKPPLERVETSKFQIYAGVMSAAAVLFLVAFLNLFPVKTNESKVVAFLLDSRDAVWTEGDGILDNGAGIKPGLLSLTSGYATVVLTSGVEIVLHGPVTVDIESDNQVFLLRGAIYSKVPKGANGYLVRTNGATVIDYGTEFAVEVGGRGVTTASVFKGQVELRSGADVVKHGSTKRLQARQAAVVDNDGEIKAVNFVPERYVTSIPSDYDIAVLKSKPIACWRFANYSNPLNEINSKTHVARYVGNVNFTDSSELNVGPHEQALNLDGQGGHVAITVEKEPTENSGWSCMLWIRPELHSDMQKEYYYVLSGKGQYGHLRASGSGILEHYFEKGNGERYYIQSSNTNMRSGQWYHIVVTCKHGHEKNMYINGMRACEPVVSLTAASSVSKELLIGMDHEKSSSLTSSTLSMDVPFRGDISQVALYDRPLSESEIKQLYLSVKER